MKKSILPAFPVLTLFFLLLFPQLSFEGAKNGLLLWFNVVLPTLLPFMLCSSLIVSWNGVGYLTKPLKPFLRRFGFSEGGSYTLICGLLCGYPMGAKTAADFVRRGTITSCEGKRLLAVSGCPSPMFLAGYIKMNLPPSVPFWHVAAALYIPVLLLIFISGHIYGKNMQEPTVLQQAVPKVFDDILMGALEIMVKIGGYIMLFSILAVYAGHFLPQKAIFKPLLLGLIEMTTGIQTITLSMTGTKAAAAIGASAAFGGLSGVFQTKTVIKNAGLSIRHYVLWKLLHAALTGILIVVLSYL